jgi:putative FmdB family regulatory protein
MPIYEYRCPKCGEFEHFQRITDSALKRCPTCRSAVTKLISTTAFQFKGTGWYVTDYARQGGAGAGDGAAKNGGAASTETAGSDGGTTADGKTTSSADKTATKAPASGKPASGGA